MHKNETPKPIWTKFCMVVGIRNVITYTNYGDLHLWGFWWLGIKFPLSPKTFRHRPYNTVALLCKFVNHRL